MTDLGGSGSTETKLRRGTKVIAIFALTTLIGGYVGYRMNVWGPALDRLVGKTLTSHAATPAAHPLLEGSISVANMASETRYESTTRANPGDTVKFRVYVRNRELSWKARSLVIDWVQEGPTNHDRRIGMRISGGDFPVTGTASVVSDLPIKLELLPESGLLKAVGRNGAVFEQEITVLGGKILLPPLLAETGQDELTVTMQFRVSAASH